MAKIEVKPKLKKTKEGEFITAAMVTDERREMIHNALHERLRAIAKREGWKLIYWKNEWINDAVPMYLGGIHSDRFHSKLSGKFLFKSSDPKVWMTHRLRGMIEVAFIDPTPPLTTEKLLFFGRAFCVWGDTFDPKFGKLLAEYRLLRKAKEVGLTQVQFDGCLREEHQWIIAHIQDVLPVKRVDLNGTETIFSSTSIYSDDDTFRNLVKVIEQSRFDLSILRFRLTPKLEREEEEAEAEEGITEFEEEQKEDTEKDEE